ncbi:Hypothetical predicted protein [Xyrichtys novacula]|uniref:NTR domain-containing protein n=1 Tax=Xyrichtys novacula TaxID=13765 RepID=A0AAV1EXA2_XYRNO|nr:Hypothetical predicted protein [Xyrichtys novacula]
MKGLDRRMCRTPLWLLAFLTFSSQTFISDGSPLQVLSAPNLLRVGTTENVFVECQDCTGGDIEVTINVMNHPTKTTRLASTAVTLTSQNNFQQFGQITVPPEHFNRDPNMKQYVYLQAQFPDRLLEKVVLVSFQSGYIFIQTDKTLYTPGSTVLYRIYAVTPQMMPVERDNAVAIEMVTPEGIILPDGVFAPHSGFYSGSYHMRQNDRLGLWKVVAKFESNPQQSFSAEFEVKEYVLPSFEVKLTSETSIFYLDDHELNINIEANYRFGEWVDGTAYAVFGVVHDGQKKSFRSSIQRLMIQKGHGEATLKREHITQVFSNIVDLEGRQMYVSVTVLTKNGGEMVETELNGIKIVRSPYTINFKRTPKYYKPGLYLDVMIEVLNPDGTAARGVHVVMDPGGLEGVTDYNGIAELLIDTPKNPEPLTVTVRTMDHRIERGRQATQAMVALPYRTRSNNYMDIGVSRNVVELGESLRISLVASAPKFEITYLILSRGQLIRYDRIPFPRSLLISKMISITEDMLPSFRIIAYYHTDNNEVVSDSVWVDVKDNCKYPFNLERTTGERLYTPGYGFDLRITGNPGVRVAVVAADKRFSFLNNKLHLTQKKLWDTVEKFDTGCTPGGGKDSMGVFYDAGLLFESSTSGTPHRLDLKCADHSRWKRASTVWDLTWDAEEDDEYLNSEEIFVRSHLFETWMWSDWELPACPLHDLNCTTISDKKRFNLPYSIATWQVTAIALSKTHGICVAEPLDVVTRKMFFIDLILPHSAVQGQQLEIKAILHNYIEEAVTVRVDLIENKDLCSAASMREKYRQKVQVEAESTRSVPFIIFPTKQGEFLIEVIAAVKETSLADRIFKKLHVVPEGTLTKSVMSMSLDPARKGIEGIHETTINSDIPRKYLAPNTPIWTEIFLTGKPTEGELLENVISGDSMGALIRQPSHSYNLDTIYTLSLPVIATIYLDKTNQWEAVGFEKRNEALEYIKTGYNKHKLDYRRSDGSFGIHYPFLFFPKQAYSRLTAHVIKVLTMAHNLVPVSVNIICDAVTFLIIQAQRPDGSFRSDTFDTSCTDCGASTTAFCLIAMQESAKLCISNVDFDGLGLFYGSSLAVSDLEAQLPSLTNPYAVAMVSYALANDDRLNKEVLYRFASRDLTHWPTSEGSALTLETTAYALLALVKAKAFKEARPVVRWLKQQERESGGYGSLEATLLVYQAVAEYWSNVNEPEYDLDVDVRLPGRLREMRFHFDRRNQFTTRRINAFNTIKGTRVIARGTGELTVTMVSHYYTLPGVQEKDCPIFKLSVQLLPEISIGDGKIYRLKIELLNKNEEVDNTETVLDIGLLSGFTANTDDLRSLSRSPNITVENFENTNISDFIIIHLNEVSHSQPEEITFRIHEKFKAQILQPAAVSVYRLRKREQSCVKFYHPERKNGELPVYCVDGECTCLAVLDNCSMQRSKALSNEERTTITGIDFAYKINFDHTVGENLTAQIVEVIKAGDVDVAPLGKQRRIIVSSQCRAALQLTPDDDFLIMGASTDIQRFSGRFQYVIGENTWVEHWPSECHHKRYERTCLGMKKLIRQYEVFKCRQ